MRMEQLCRMYDREHEARHSWIPYLIFFGVLALFFIPLLPQLKVLSGGDLVNQYIPYKIFWRTWIQKGVFPLWNPLIFGGRPYVADIQLGLFYPPNYLHVVLSPATAFTILTILHIFMGLAGCYRLFHDILKAQSSIAVIGSLFLMFSGFFVCRLYSGIVLFIYAGAWMPWIFYMCARWLITYRLSCAALTGLFLCMQVLSGAPQVTLITGYGLGIFLLVYIFLKKSYMRAQKGALLQLVGGSALIFLLGAGLSAIQAIPSIEFMRYSFERAGKTAWEYATINSLSPRYFLTWVIPFIFCDPAKPEIYWGGEDGYWEINGYMGMVPLVLVGLFIILCFSRRVRREMLPSGDEYFLKKVFVISAALFIIIGIGIAMGKYSPLYWLAYHIMPGVDKFRVPARWLLLYLFSMATLAVIALDFIVKNAEEYQSDLKIASIIILVVSVIPGMIMLLALPLALDSLGLLKTFAAAPPDIFDRLITECMAYARTSITTSLVIAVCCIALVLLFIGRRLTQHTFIVLMGFIVLADVMMFGERFLLAEPVAIFNKKNYPETPLIRLLVQHVGERQTRFLALDDVHYWTNDQNQMEIYADRGMVYSLHDARGYDPVYIRSYGEFMNVLTGRPVNQSPGALLFVEHITNPALLNLLNVELVLTYREDFQQAGMQLLWKAPFGLYVYRNTDVSGSAFIASAQLFKGSDEELFARLAALKDVETVFTDVFIPEGTMAAVAPVPAANNVSVATSTPNRRIYNVACKTGNILVFSENYYRGWRVFVDGRRVPIIKVNHTFSGVYITPGTHKVEKRFMPASFLAGGVISIISIIIFVLCCMVRSLSQAYSRKKQ